MEKKEIFKKIMDFYASEDLDEYVHDAKGQEAANINNSGLEAQLEYLEQRNGLIWIYKHFLEES